MSIMEMQQNPLAQIAEYVSILKRNVWWIFLGTVVFSAIGFTMIALMPDRYQAITTILVDPQKIPERYVASTVSSDPSSRLNTITQEVLSVTRLQQIIDQLKLYPELKNHPREEIIELMRKDIDIQVKQGSAAGLSSFTITYEGRNPSVVAQVANQLASSFIEWNLKSREQVAVGTTEFLQSQLDDAKKSLEEQEKKVGEYKLQHVGEMPDQQTANLQTLSQLQSSMQANSDQLNRLDMERLLLVRTGDTDPRTGAVGRPLTERGRLEQEKHQLEAQLADLRRRYTAAYPEVVDATARLQAVSSQLAAMPPDSPETIAKEAPAQNVRLQVIEREMKRLNDEQKSIANQIAVYRKRVEAAPVREEQMAELNRNYAVSQEHYKSLLDKTFSAGMAADLERQQEGERFMILDPAQVPEKPIKPNRRILFPAALLFSLALCAAGIFAWELMKGGIRSEPQLKAMLPKGVPLLGSVPAIATASERRQSYGRAALALAASVVVCIVEAGVLWKIHPHL